VVALTAPRSPVGCSEDGVHLVVVEIDDTRSAGPLGGDGQDASDELGVLGVPERGLTEKGVDGCQARVAGGGTDVALMLEHVQEPGDRLIIEVREVELSWLDTVSFVRIKEEQAHAVSIRRDRVGAHVAPSDEVIDEPRLQRGGQGCHCGLLCSAAAMRSETADMSSGLAVRHQ
jgi:hypothetical protein